MNERGFFTLIGLCFLIIAAILVRGVQASEGNYYSNADDFITAAELQNIADSALIEAVELIKSGEVTLERPVAYAYSRKVNQYPVPLNHTYNADVQVFYEYGINTTATNNKGNIFLKKKLYPSKEIVDRYTKNNRREGVIIFSVASRESEKIGGKVYRRAIAYFFTDDDSDEKIYFMNSLKDD